MGDIKRSKTRWIGAGLACALACTLGQACAPTGGAGEPRSARPANLLLVTVDTLRADRTEGGGLTPELARFAARGRVYSRARASSSWTLPSLASLFTGRFPAEHRCWTLSSRLAPAEETLAETLYARGWDTAAFVANHLVGRQYGLDQGFAWYDDELAQAAVSPELYQRETDTELVDRALAWFEARAASERAGGAERPWFVWVHLFDPHSVYRAHAEFPFGDEPVQRYDAEVAHTDRQFGRLLDGLDGLGLSEGTWIVFTSDHGEEFGEHGGEDHGHTLYDELIRVPLVVVGPGLERGRSDELVSQVGLRRALLAATGGGPFELASGGDLAAELRASDGSLRRTVIEDGWKAVLGGVDGDLLFDLAADPGELRDLAPDQAARLAALRELAARHAAGLTEPTAEERLDLAPLEVLEFGALGYTE